MTSDSPDPDVTVRRAERDDVPAIVRLLADDQLGAKRERVEEPVAPNYLAAFDEIDADPGNEVLLAVQGGEVIGCLQLTIIPGLGRVGMKRAQLESVTRQQQASGRPGRRAPRAGGGHARAGSGLRPRPAYERRDANRCSALL